MYVVNIRLAIVKHFDGIYFCRRTFRDKILGYHVRLSGWIAYLNDRIIHSHTVTVISATLDVSRGNPPINRVVHFWLATHRRNNTIVASFAGPLDDLSGDARRAVEGLVNASRRDAIEAHRQEFGVPEMELTLAAWVDAFDLRLRQALVTGLLSRPMRAIDTSRQSGLMVDGRALAGPLDRRTSLLEVLTSTEFHRRLRRQWDAFVADGDDRLAQVAHRRLFGGDATNEYVVLLRDIASKLGFGAFVAALLYSDEYTSRYGDGIPENEISVAAELSDSEDSDHTLRD